MTGPIAYTRSLIATTLAAIPDLADIPVLTNIPERINPPCIVLTEGVPLLTHSGTFGTVNVTMTVTVIIAPTTNALAIERLDALVDTLVVNLMGVHDLTSVDTYTTISAADGQRYLAAKLDLTTSITIERE